MDDILNSITKGVYVYRPNHDIYWKKKDFVLKAVKNNNWALNYASKELKNDKEVVLEAIKKSGHSLTFASEKLRDDKEFVLEAVKNNLSLYWVCDKLRNDKEIVHCAIKINGNNFRYASKELKNNKKIITLVFKRLHYIDYLKYKKTKDIVEIQFNKKFLKKSFEKILRFY